MKRDLSERNILESQVSLTVVGGYENLHVQVDGGKTHTTRVHFGTAEKGN